MECVACGIKIFANDHLLDKRNTDLRVYNKKRNYTNNSY